MSSNKRQKEYLPSESSSSKSEDRKPGRPVGGGIEPVAGESVAAVCCTACGLTALTVLSSISRPLEGWFNEKYYNLIRWQRCRCRECGQVQMVKKYEVTPTYPESG